MNCPDNTPVFDPCANDFQQISCTAGLLAPEAVRIFNHNTRVLECLLGPKAEVIEFGLVDTNQSGDLNTYVTAGVDSNLTFTLDTSNPCSDRITLNPDGTFTVDVN